MKTIDILQIIVFVISIVIMVWAIYEAQRLRKQTNEIKKHYSLSDRSVTDDGKIVKEDEFKGLFKGQVTEDVDTGDLYTWDGYQWIKIKT